MFHGFLGVEHRGNTAEDNLNASFSIRISNLPASFYLDSEHHRNTNEVHIIVKIYLLQIFVHKININIIG